MFADNRNIEEDIFRVVRTEASCQSFYVEKKEVALILDSDPRVFMPGPETVQCVQWSPVESEVYNCSAQYCGT